MEQLQAFDEGTCGTSDLTDVLEGACTVLVVDPPWSYGRDTGRTRTAEKHYQTIGHNGGEINRKTGAGIEGIIAATPVPTFAAKDCHLYLWTTNPKLPFAFDVMKAWGFEYKTTLTWLKTKNGGGVHGGGMGWFFRGATEHVLFGVKGNKGIPSGLRKPNVVMAGTGEHSEKPVEFYDLLRSIYGGDEVMADLYARKAHDRFHAWGNEAPSNASARGKEAKMAIEVVGEDPDKKKRITCPNCAAILEYTLADTRTENVRDYGGGSDTYRRLDCPRCKDIVTVPMW